MGILKSKREKVENALHTCPVCDYEFKGEYEKCPECGALLGGEPVVVANEPDNKKDTVVDLDISNMVSEEPKDEFADLLGEENEEEDIIEKIEDEEEELGEVEDFDLGDNVDSSELDELLSAEESTEEVDDLDDLLSDEPEEEIEEADEPISEVEPEDLLDELEEDAEEVEEAPMEEIAEDEEELVEFDEDGDTALATKEDIQEVTHEEESGKTILLDELASKAETKTIPLGKVANLPQSDKTIVRAKGNGFEIVTAGYVDVKVIKVTDEEAELLRVDKELKTGNLSVFEKAKLYQVEEEHIEIVKGLFKADNVGELNGIPQEEVDRHVKVAESLSEKFEGIYFSLETAEALAKMTKASQNLVGAIAIDMGTEHITLDTAKKLKAEKDLDESKVIRMLSQDTSNLPEKETLRDMIRTVVREELADVIRDVVREEFSKA